MGDGQNKFEEAADDSKIDNALNICNLCIFFNTLKDNLLFLFSWLILVEELNNAEGLDDIGRGGNDANKDNAGIPVPVMTKGVSDIGGMFFTKILFLLYW